MGDFTSEISKGRMHNTFRQEYSASFTCSQVCCRVHLIIPEISWHVILLTQDVHYRTFNSFQGPTQGILSLGTRRPSTCLSTMAHSIPEVRESITTVALIRANNKRVNRRH